MENKPILYYSCIDGVAFDSFCSDAAIGARDSRIEAIGFEDISEVPQDPYNIIVASVEDTLKYLGRNIPVIDHSWTDTFLRRKSEVFENIDSIDKYPCFIKPAEEIKAFTGFVSSDREFSNMCSYNYKGSVLRQEVISIKSEYRVYMSNLLGILGVHWYSGDPFAKLDKDFVEFVCNQSRHNLSEQSYTLDFGIMDDGETFLIEVNDGWAIGNYGLPPLKYYNFVKNRFLQLTGVIK